MEFPVSTIFSNNQPAPDSSVPRASNLVAETWGSVPGARKACSSVGPFPTVLFAFTVDLDQLADRCRNVAFANESEGEKNYSGLKCITQMRIL